MEDFGNVLFSIGSIIAVVLGWKAGRGLGVAFGIVTLVGLSVIISGCYRLLIKGGAIFIL